MKVKHRLPLIMATKGIRSIRELARLTGFKERSLYRFYNNETQTYDPELLAAVCQSLQCKIDELLYLEDGQAS